MNSRILCVGLAAFSVGHAAEAQYQTQNRTARTTALSVSEVGTPANGLTSTMTIEGPPGLAFSLFMELPSAANQTHQFPDGLGNLYLPINLDLASPNFLNLTPGLPITTIPAGPVPSLTIPFPPQPFAVGLAMEFQANTLNPAVPLPGGVSLSNGVRRTVPGPLAPAYGFQTLGAGAPAVEYIDIEQADIDADGDQDTLLLSCTGNLTWIPGQGAPAGMKPHHIVPVPVPGVGGGLTTANNNTVLSFELADLNGDDWYDLVIGGGSPTLGFSVYLNRGAAPPPIAGSSVMGLWNGFANTPITVDVNPVNPEVNELEVADIDLDGNIDIVLATPGPEVVMQNLGGGATFLTVSLPSPDPANDNSSDVELADMDGDGDFDLIVANRVGQLNAPSINWYYPNVSVPTAPLFAPAVALDNSIEESGFTCDVEAGDFDNDGDLDIYAGNSTAGVINPLGITQEDALYLGDGTGNFVVASQLLPDNLAFVGPLGARIAPAPTSDVEGVDTQRVGTSDIAVAHGFKCGSESTLGLDLRMLTRQFDVDGQLYFADNLALDRNPATGIGWLSGVGINDMETGDWQTFFPDADIGVVGTVGAGPTGYWVLTR